MQNRNAGRPSVFQKFLFSSQTVLLYCVEHGIVRIKFSHINNIMWLWKFSYNNYSYVATVSLLYPNVSQSVHWLLKPGATYLTFSSEQQPSVYFKVKLCMEMRA